MSGTGREAKLLADEDRVKKRKAFAIPIALLCALERSSLYNYRFVGNPRFATAVALPAKLCACGPSTLPA
jgi:hypothetical protein